MGVFTSNIPTQSSKTQPHTVCNNWDLVIIIVTITASTSLPIVTPTAAITMISPCSTSHTLLSTIPQSSTPFPTFFDLLDNIYVTTCRLRAKLLAMLDMLPSASAWTITYATNPCPLRVIWYPYWLHIIFPHSGSCISSQYSLDFINFPFMDPHTLCASHHLSILFPTVSLH